MSNDRINISGMDFDASEFAPTPKKKVRPTGWKEWLGTVIFMIVVLKFGYTGLAFAGFLTAIVVMAVGAMGGYGFLQKLQNNNWVFWAMFWLTIASLLFWLLGLEGNPLPEINPVTVIKEKIKEGPRPLVDPWADDGLDKKLTGFLLGSEGGWFKATISFAIWTIIAYPICFWDDWRAKAKERAAKGGGKGLLGILGEIFVKEGIGTAMWKPLRREKHQEEDEK